MPPSLGTSYPGSTQQALFAACPTLLPRSPLQEAEASLTEDGRKNNFSCLVLGQEYVWADPRPRVVSQLCPLCHAAGQMHCSLLQVLVWFGKEMAPCTHPPSLAPLVPPRGRKLGKPTFHLGDEPQAALEVGADGVEAPAELGIAAVLVGPAGVVTNVQLVAALGHGRDAQI